MKLACRMVASLLFIFSCNAIAQDQTVHGLWVYKTPILLDLPSRGEELRDFCRKNFINEVYLSYTSQNGGDAEQQEIQRVIGLLHNDHIRVEALLVTKDGDQAGAHRDKLMEHVNEVVSYNKGHAHQRFDGIHLDIEPWQREENKAAGNISFLPGLLDAYRAVRAVAEQNEMTVNADISARLFKADPNQRRALMTALPRFTLLLYGVKGGQSKLSQAATQNFQLAYQGLDAPNLARMGVGLRYTDYPQQIFEMLRSTQDLLNRNPHYLGWAWNSYNDVVPQS
jgi:hypothetical protein